MATGTFTEDGSTDWFWVDDNAGINIAAEGTWGSGTITPQYYIDGSAKPILDGTTGITFTADFNEGLELRRGQYVRLTLSGSTSPDLNWEITGAVTSVGSTI